MKNDKRINGCLVRKNPQYPRYWDVIDPVRGKATFTGTLKEIQKATKVKPCGDGHYVRHTVCRNK